MFDIIDIIIKQLKRLYAMQLGSIMRHYRCVTRGLWSE